MSSLQTNARFGNAPSISRQRSTFPMDQRHITTFNVGEIIPFFTYTDVLPGDTFKLNCSFVIRMQTPLNPTMDDLVADIYWFYDRTRNTWAHFRDFMGENNGSAWYSTTEYNVPQWGMTYNETTNPTYGQKTCWDYMGLACNQEYNPTHTDCAKVNAFAIRSYVRIYNRFFRDENFIAPITEITSDSATMLDVTNDYSGKILKASRLADYFSKGLPGPQKGAPLTIPLGQSAPVIGNGKVLGLTDGTNEYGTLLANTTENYRMATTDYAGADLDNSTHAIGASGTWPAIASGQGTLIGVSKDAEYSGLIADLSNAVGATVNALRLAVQTQKILELDARRGTRFPEIISAHYGVIAPDATIDYPEYLGGTRVPINITAVANTTGTSDAPQGYLGAFSHTVGGDNMFTKSFTEWGTLIGIVVVRIASHTYSQGVNRMWSRNNRLDYYWPTLANLGEGPVYNQEIYYTGSTANGANTYNQEVWAYQERWAEYRYIPNITSGEMRPTYTENGNNLSLDVWHYGDYYTSAPGMNQTWLEEDKNYVTRTLAVQSKDQMLADFNTHIICTREMPLYSVPGLVDHF